MNRIVAVISLLAAVFCSPARAAERPIVAVFPIQDVTSKLDPAMLEPLTEYLSAAVAAGGTFSIQAPGDMRRLLTEKRTESYKACFDEKCQIELGRELAANKMITAKIIQLGTACTVTAALYDLRTQATDTTATADGGCGPAALKRSLDKVAGKVRAWSASGRIGAGDRFKEGQIGERVLRLDGGGGEEAIVAFASQPEGAVVIVDGTLVCESTPCSRKFPVGPHEVSLQKKRYRGRTEQVVFAKGAELSWELEPTFGMISVDSSPPGQAVQINGERIGVTPLSRHPVDAGNYEVLVTSPCHYDAGERVQVAKAEDRRVDVSLKPKLGGLVVDAKDSAGNDVSAELFIDGEPLGEAPGRFEVSVCSKQLTARNAKHGAAEVALSVQEGEWRPLLVKLDTGVAIKAGSKEPGQADGAVASGAEKSFVGLRLAPTVGYVSLSGISAKLSEGGKGTLKAKGPTAGARVDLSLMELFAVSARYDYQFLNGAGNAFLGAGVTYGGLLGKVDQDNFSLVPNVGMWVGLALIHGSQDSFELETSTEQVLDEDVMNLGMQVSVDLSADMLFAKYFYLGLSGEFGYLYLSYGSSSSAAYFLGGSVRVGVQF